MKVLIRSIVLLLILSPLALSASENVKTTEKRTRRPKHELPLRAIDRPLTLPQRNVQLSAGYMAGITWDKDSGVTTVHGQFFSDKNGSFSSPYHLFEKPLIFCPDFTYAFNDSLEISTRWLLPTLTYTFLNNSVKDENGVITIAKPSIAVFAGLHELSFWSIDSTFTFGISGGLKGKFPINRSLWSDAMVKFTGGNTQEINFTYRAGLGIQFHDKISLVSTAQLTHTIETGTPHSHLYPQFETELDFNFSRHFGMDIYAIISEAYIESVHCSFGTTLNFNW